MKNNKKGFTLMEMLIVVAIIAVLVAIAIPVLNGALEKSREATDAANLRAAYAEVTVTYLEDGTANSKDVKAVQTVDGWESFTFSATEDTIGGLVPADYADGNYGWTVGCAADGTVTIVAKAS